jgi:hypothetical protein
MCLLESSSLRDDEGGYWRRVIALTLTLPHVELGATCVYVTHD